MKIPSKIRPPLWKYDFVQLKSINFRWLSKLEGPIIVLSKGEEFLEGFINFDYLQKTNQITEENIKKTLLQVNRYFFTFVEVVQIPSVGINLKMKCWFLICLGASRIAQIWIDKSPKIRLRTSAAYILLDQFCTWNSGRLRLVATIDIRVESLAPFMSLPINFNHQIYQGFHSSRFLNQVYFMINIFVHTF